MDEHIGKFTGELKWAFGSGFFIKLTLGKPVSDDEDGVQRVVIRAVEIREEKKLSFVYKYPTKHITKNYSLQEAVAELTALLGDVFLNAVLFTAAKDMRLSFNRKKKANIRYGKPTCTLPDTAAHDARKERFISIDDNQYLKDLGVVIEGGQLSYAMRSKFKQINRYIETIDALITSSGLKEKEKLEIADMGSGKGYLTFALYDYLTHTLKKEAHVTGVEMREELVIICSGIATKCGFENLDFHQGDIASYPKGKMDMLIALHACDTATDDAIYQGITSDADVIITAPCCHRQIRKELNVTDGLASIVAHGILEERQAELVTDTLRGLVLEAHGYKTRIFEFITDEHTHKNVMIVGVKNAAKKDAVASLEKIAAVKKLFGIENFYLESLFVR
ncbi:MAG: SAM-dependent methyltransferase [Candidatus Moranbacteria bacterium]|nr:SAM-dependent methyltransferase [Candidatus Moranbacteria bacterium]